MYQRSLLCLSLGLSACVTTAFVPPGTQDSDTDVGVDGTDVETDTPTETDDTEDTTDDTAGWLDDTDDDGGGPIGPGTPLNCHPFDPVSYGNWTRKYRIDFGNTQGWENHASVGYSPIPNAIINNFPLVQVTDGYGFTVNITGAGSNNVQSTYWSICDHGGLQGAYDIASTVTRSNQTLRAGAKDPHRYLPKESEMYASVLLPGWTEESKYKIRVPNPNIIAQCDQFANGSRDVTATYASFGFEQIDIAALGGTVDAYRINVVVDQSISLASDPLNPLCNIIGATFGALFQELLGGLFGNVDSETGEFARASFDRWYVRGVGLVKEEAFDLSIPSQPATMFSKTLTQCSGLPDCP